MSLLVLGGHPAWQLLPHITTILFLPGAFQRVPLLFCTWKPSGGAALHVGLTQNTGSDHADPLHHPELVAPTSPLLMVLFETALGSEAQCQLAAPNRWASLVRDQQCRCLCKKWNKKWEKANSLPPFILPTLLNLSQSPQQSWHHAVTYFVFLDGTELQALVHLPGTPKAFVANSSCGNHTLHHLFFSPGIPNVDSGS